MAQDSDDGDPVTDSGAVGFVREGLRTLAPALGRDPDELAAEVDRTVESVTPPDATAQDLDAVVGAVAKSAQARRSQPEAARRDPMIRHVAGGEDTDRIIVDYAPSDVTLQATGGTLFVTVEPADYTERFEFTDNVTISSIETEAGGMAAYEIEPLDDEDGEDIPVDVSDDDLESDLEDAEVDEDELVEELEDSAEDDDPPSEEAESVAKTFESDEDDEE